MLDSMVYKNQMSLEERTIHSKETVDVVVVVVVFACRYSFSAPSYNVAHI